MPTQEERLTALEQTQVGVNRSLKDLNHYVTMLIGIVQREEWEIREMKGSLRSIDKRLASFEKSVNTRFGTLEGRIEAQDKKLDQILLSLAALTTKTNQEA